MAPATESYSNKIVVDWKFSSSSDPLRVLQLAGYAYAYWEETGEKINTGMIVRINPKTGKLCKPKVYKSLWKKTRLFLALREIYDITRSKDDAAE